MTRDQTMENKKRRQVKCNEKTSHSIRSYVIVAQVLTFISVC